MLRLASCAGIDTLDTAIAYGESEKCLGESGVGGFNLVTKLPGVPDDCANVSGWVQNEVAASLRRLGVSGLYGLLLHRPEQLSSSYGKYLYQALQRLKESGVVKKLGISIYTPIELEPISKLFRFDLVQAPFNLVDRRLHSSGWMSRLKNEGIEIHSRSVFLQGLLLLEQCEMPRKFAQWNQLWSRWQQWLSDRGASPLHTCLAFALAFPEIDRVVVGADNTVQLAQIISAARAAGSDNFPDLNCDDESLINPALWPTL